MSRLETNLAAETSARQSADNNLQAQITALKNAHQADMATINAQFATLTSSLNTLKGRLDGNEFVKNSTTISTDSLSLKVVNDSSSSTGKAVKAYLGSTEVPLVSQGNFSSLFSDSGYCQLPNGFIMQWGEFEVAQDTVYTNIKFPIKFPNKAISVFFSLCVNSGVGLQYDSHGENSYVYVDNMSFTFGYVKLFY